jgi:hypothetical protein
MFAVTMMLRWQIFTTQEAHVAVQVAAKRLGVSPGECVRHIAQTASAIDEAQRLRDAAAIDGDLDRVRNTRRIGGLKMDLDALRRDWKSVCGRVSQVPLASQRAERRQTRLRPPLGRHPKARFPAGSVDCSF